MVDSLDSTDNVTKVETSSLVLDSTVSEKGFENSHEYSYLRNLTPEVLSKAMFSSSLSCPSRPAPSLPATVTEYSPSDVRSVMLSELLLSVVL